MRRFATAAAGVMMLAIPIAHADDVPAPPDVPTIAIEFQADGVAWSAKADVELDATAMWLKADPARRVVIATGAEGHITSQRATLVREELIAAGVDPMQVVIVQPDEPLPIGEVRRIVFYNADEAPIQTEPMGDTPPGPPPSATAQQVNVHVEEPVEQKAVLATPFGVSMSLGGGVTNFADDDMRSFSSVGGAWEARLGLGTRTPLTGELAYVGTAQEVDALGLDRDAVLVSNGVEGVARFNLTTTFALQPYVFGGVGWARYDMTRTTVNTSSLREHDDILYLPAGVGFGVRAGNLLFDLRGTFRKAYRDEIAKTPTGSTDESVGLDSWMLGAKVGWEL